YRTTPSPSCISPLSLHDALPIWFFYLLLRKTVGVSQSPKLENAIRPGSPDWDKYQKLIALDDPEADEAKRALGDIVMTLHTTARDRKSTRLNSSHQIISYAVFCL